ncbi:MAG: metalloregulator ArsR/SmtB family transcription factor [Clostridium sp.]|nr:metalloregulator ArsR/SmtB family transcription factor [Clostridium sp.]
MTHYHLPHDHGQNIGHVLDRMPDLSDFQKVAAWFDKLGDGTRLRILWLLCHCEECVSNIAAAMEMSDPAVSHHLRLLRESGLIVSRREGKEVYYKLAENAQAQILHRALDEMFEVSCPSGDEA